MRFLSWLVSLPLLAILVIFVLQNRERVSISFWPFDLGIELPVSILTLGVLLIGFLGGALAGGFALFAARREARKYKREAAALGDKLKAEQAVSVAVPASFIGGVYKTVAPQAQPSAPKAKPSFFSKLLHK